MSASMIRLGVFNNVSLDGYFVDSSGDMRWAHNTKPDPEWDAFVAGNASGGGRLLFGRKTYDLMASYWPTPMAAKNMPAVAEGMNKMPKIVFSRTLARADWNNTTLLKGDLVAEVRKLKNDSGPDMAILGSGSIVTQLAQENLIDQFQVAVIPIVLGAGRTMFDGVKRRLNLKLTNSRAYRNGNVVLSYESA
jgi:dihydrofolate reductase